MPIEPSFTSFTLLSVRSVKNDTPCFQPFTVKLPPFFHTFTGPRFSLVRKSSSRSTGHAVYFSERRGGVGGIHQNTPLTSPDLFQICT